MRRLLVLLPTLVVALIVVVGASAGTAHHQGHETFSDNWQGITFVGGLSSCPIFPADSEFILNGSDFFNVFFSGTNLTDHINDRVVPDAANDGLFIFSGVASVHGTITASNGVYTVSGGGFHENRLDGFPYYFAGSGHATITGPGGTVTGTATFQDLLDFPPQEFDLDFTSISSCHLT